MSEDKLCDYCGEGVAIIESSMHGKSFCSRLCEDQYWRDDYEELVEFARKLGFKT